MKQAPYPIANPYKTFVRPEPEFFLKRFRKVFLQSTQRSSIDSKVYSTLVPLSSPPQPEYYNPTLVLHLFTPVDGFSNEEFKKGCGIGKYSIHLCPPSAKRNTINLATSHVAQLPIKPIFSTLKTQKKSDDLELSDIPLPKEKPKLLEPSESVFSDRESSEDTDLSYKKIIGVQCLDSELSYKKINNTQVSNCKVIKQTINTPIKATAKTITKK